jgi:hypothetical protein
MIQTRKEMKQLLKSSCKGVLQDVIDNVGLNEEEIKLFKERYLNERSVPVICIMLHCGTNKYNNMHNRILDKTRSHFNRILMI